MNGRISSVVLAATVMMLALVPAMAEETDGEDEKYGVMVLCFHDKNGKVLLNNEITGPDYIIRCDFPAVEGATGWRIYGIEYPGTFLYGVSLKDYSVSWATWANPVVVDAYPMFDSPAPAGTEEGINHNALIAILVIVLMLAVIIGGFIMMGGGGRDCTGHDAYSPFYDDRWRRGRP